MIWLIDKTRITKNKIVCVNEEKLKEKLEELLTGNNTITLKIIKEALDKKHNEFFNLIQLFNKSNIDLEMFAITNYFDETVHTDFKAFLSILPFIKFEVTDSYGINHLKKVEKVFTSRGINNLEISIILNNVVNASKNSKILTISQSLTTKQNKFRL